MSECSSLLEHHCSYGTAVAGHFPVATEGYGPLVQMRTIVVHSSEGCADIITPVATVL
jgi:hypothetical protein